jgi:STE24 endopeptidase
VEAVIGFFMNWNTRKNEFQADSFAKNMGLQKELRSGLIKLQSSNLGMMNPDWLYSMWHHSHPPLIERLEALGTETEKDARKPSTAGKKKK